MVPEDRAKPIFIFSEGGIGEREKCLVQVPVVLLASEHSLHLAGSCNPHLGGPRPRCAEDRTHFRCWLDAKRV